MSREVAITTKDNPFDPLDEFQQWYAFDTANGYNTCALLARLTQTSHELSELDQLQELELAIDEMIEFNITGNYVKITRDSTETKSED